MVCVDPLLWERREIWLSFGLSNERIILVSLLSAFQDFLGRVVGSEEKWRGRWDKNEISALHVKSCTLMFFYTIASVIFL